MICPNCGHDFYVDAAYARCDACGRFFYASQSATCQSATCQGPSLPPPAFGGAAAGGSWGNSGGTAK